MGIMAKQGRIAHRETGTLMALLAHQDQRVFRALDLGSGRKDSHVSRLHLFPACLYFPSCYAG